MFSQTDAGAAGSELLIATVPESAPSKGRSESANPATAGIRRVRASPCFSGYLLKCLLLCHLNLSSRGSGGELGPLDHPPPDPLPCKQYFLSMAHATSSANSESSKRFPSSASLEPGRISSPPPPDLPLYLKIFFATAEHTTPSATLRV